MTTRMEDGRHRIEARRGPTPSPKRRARTSILLLGRRTYDIFAAIGQKRREPSDRGRTERRDQNMCDAPAGQPRNGAPSRILAADILEGVRGVQGKGRP